MPWLLDGVLESHPHSFDGQVAALMEMGFQYVEGGNAEALADSVIWMTDESGDSDSDVEFVAPPPRQPLPLARRLPPPVAPCRSSCCEVAGDAAPYLVDVVTGELPLPGEAVYRCPLGCDGNLLLSTVLSMIRSGRSVLCVICRAPLASEHGWIPLSRGVEGASDALMVPCPSGCGELHPRGDVHVGNFPCAAAVAATPPPMSPRGVPPPVNAAAAAAAAAPSPEASAVVAGVSLYFASRADIAESKQERADLGESKEQQPVAESKGERADMAEDEGERADLSEGKEEEGEGPRSMPKTATILVGYVYRFLGMMAVVLDYNPATSEATLLPIEAVLIHMRENEGRDSRMTLPRPIECAIADLTNDSSTLQYRPKDLAHLVGVTQQQLTRGMLNYIADLPQGVGGANSAAGAAETAAETVGIRQFHQDKHLWQENLRRLGTGWFGDDSPLAVLLQEGRDRNHRASRATGDRYTTRQPEITAAELDVRDLAATADNRNGGSREAIEMVDIRRMDCTALRDELVRLDLDHTGLKAALGGSQYFC
jgi:hypothetical protein